MAILRNHTQNFTIVNSEILRNKELKLKDRGLLCTLLSLPDNWDFTIEGLCTILGDGRTAIRTGIGKLEELGYITRKRVRDDQGRLTDIEWNIYDTPKDRPKEPERKKSVNQYQVKKASVKSPKSENRTLDKTTEKRMVEPKSGFRTLENVRQYNTNNSTMLVNIKESSIKRGGSTSKEEATPFYPLSQKEYDTLCNEFSKPEVDYQIKKIKSKGYSNCMNVTTLRKWCTDKRKSVHAGGSKVTMPGNSFNHFPQRNYSSEEVSAIERALGNRPHQGDVVRSGKEKGELDGCEGSGRENTLSKIVERL